MTKAGRRGSLLVCDDLQIGVNGKWSAIVIYVSDIGIASDEQLAAQMVFVFTAETPKDSPWESLAFQVLFPGEDAPKRMDIPQDALQFPQIGERTKRILRSPFLIQNQKLRPGQIRASILDESGELAVQAPWIVLQA